MIKIVKDNKNLIVVVIILIFGFGLLLGYQSRQNQLIEMLIKVSEGTDKSVKNLQSSISELSDNMSAGQADGEDLISDYSIVTEEPNFTNLTAGLKVEIVPKEFTEGTKAIFYIDDQRIELSAKDNKYIGTANVSILKNYDKASVSFAKKSVINNATMPINISFSDYFTKQCTVSFIGEKKYMEGEYAYDGNIVWNRTDNAFDPILFSKLVRSVNGIIQWSKELPITNMNGEQKFVLESSFPLEPGNSFELYIEQQSRNGFTYRYYIDGGSVGEEGIFTSEDSKVPCEVYNAEGVCLTSKKN